MSRSAVTNSAEAAAALPQETVFVCRSPDETLELGQTIGRSLSPGDVVLLYGGLGAGKTQFTKGILSGLDLDVDEVTSPSFTLVNLYETSKFDVYHIDLWRLEGPNVAEAVGLDEILENKDVIVIIEWADRLDSLSFPTRSVTVTIKSDGDEPRQITIGTAKN